MTNPAGSAIVSTIGPIRQVVRGEDKIQRRYLVIAGDGREPGRAGTGAGGMSAMTQAAGFLMQAFIALIVIMCLWECKQWPQKD
jgi:hypothetical protein